MKTMIDLSIFILTEKNNKSPLGELDQANMCTVYVYIMYVH